MSLGAAARGAGRGGKVAMGLQAWPEGSRGAGRTQANPPSFSALGSHVDPKQTPGGCS